MSEIKCINMKQKDGYTTKLTYYICPDKPKASLLILHGMAEHQFRYKEFAEYLTGQGFDVYCYDHRGHGTDKKMNELGFISSANGYKVVVEDAITISEYIEKNNRANKLILIAHSMGSIIARNIILQYSNYNGVVLSGTMFPGIFTVKAGLLLSSMIKKIKGPKHISPFLNNLSVGGKKYTKLSKRTAFDWLTRDNTVVGAYINDPYCGYVCTASFYNDLVKLISIASKRKFLKLMKKDLPIFVISGEMDPVGGYGKDVKKLIALYKKIGLSNVTSKIYPDCRHELHNELNKEDVYSDIIGWLQKRL